jgi:predicted NUDIX family NTP pyrophosphohydrolase
MKKQSAGILLYRRYQSEWQVLLVHPGGPFWKNKEDGVWTIPKGEIEDSEEPLAAARREFEEETGFSPEGTAVPLTAVRLKGGKWVIPWAIPGDLDPSRIVSNKFEMEWPPNSGHMKEFPEVDRAAWFGFHEAALKINQGQVPLLEELQRLVR